MVGKSTRISVVPEPSYRQRHGSFYRPQRSCEGYVFTRVCDSSQGECLLRGGLLPGGGCSEGGVETHPRKQMATVADGTHPTGMHSC